MNRVILTLPTIVALFFSCIKDHGNYDYRELAEIRIEGMPADMEVLGFVERIRVSPRVVSSAEGEIAADDANFEFRYRLANTGFEEIGEPVGGRRRPWLDLPHGAGKDLDIPADFMAGTYSCWFMVTDKRTNTSTSELFDIRVSSTTYEGWLVLGNEGPQERVRLDMISYLSATRVEPIYDIAIGLPPIHHATQLGFHPMSTDPGTLISILSRQGSYQLDQETLESGELWGFNAMGFIAPPQETMIAKASMSVLNDPSWNLERSFVVSDAGNVYVQEHGFGGSVYGFPINTSVAGGGVEYKVAPYVGFSQVRPGNSQAALLYDSDHRRFVGFRKSSPDRLFALADPDPMLFSFETGKDMVYMEGTRRSNGLVYAILQDDAGKRSIYAINMGGNGFVQEGYYGHIDAPGFTEATHFAFHSQFPLLFYAVRNKVYRFNLGTGIAQEMTAVGLGASEEVTCLKFNLYRNSRLTNLNKQTSAFMNQQFQLIVGSYDHAAPDVNGGKVAFYEVNGESSSISRLAGYTGFAKVKDVVYRER